MRTVAHVQVVVRLDSGEEVTGDVLIGADGIWSRVRKQLIGETKANYSGYTCYTGWMRAQTAHGQRLTS